MSIETQPRSVSQTEQYEKCAWQFKLRRIDRVVPRPAAWSTHGTAFHSACEALELSGRTMSTEEAVEVFSDQYSQLMNKDLTKQPDISTWLSAGRGPAEDIEHRYKVGQEQTRHYAEWSRENNTKIWTDPKGRPGIELSFTVEFGGVSVRGFIDQLIAMPDGSVRPRDLKTGSTKSHFQLETYGLAVRKFYGVEVNAADWYLAKEGRLSRPVKLDQVTEDQVGERYAAMDAGVKAGRYPAQPGYHCRFCDVSHACSFKR
ncbi:RecB family exonuclease [Streptomyces decoyicus]